jgi:hypothetical protein
MDTPFWFEDPFILFNKSQITEILPKLGMSRNQKLNAVMRAIVVLTIVGYAFSHRIQILISGVLAMIISIFVWRFGFNKDDKKEMLKEGLAMREQMIEAENQAQLPKYTAPTKENPMMNVLVSDIQDKPDRLSAEPSFNPSVEQNINEKTKDFVVEQFNGDPKISELLFGDMVESVVFDQSMRNFHTTPATTIPNDQGAFAQFLYGEHVTCKEGHPGACENRNFRKYPM